MSDLINRQAAIDALADQLYHSAEDYRTAVKVIGNLPSAPQWIPCSESLPTTKDDYIITVKEKSLTWTDYVEWSADYHWLEYDDDMVIAWMPLPEPYKGENDRE